MGHREALLEKTLAPEKRVFGDNDIIHWLDSQAYHLLTTFISRLCDSMRGHTLSEAAQSSQPSPVCFLRQACFCGNENKGSYWYSLDT